VVGVGGECFGCLGGREVVSEATGWRGKMEPHHVCNGLLVQVCLCVFGNLKSGTG